MPVELIANGLNRRSPLPAVLIGTSFRRQLHTDVPKRFNHRWIQAFRRGAFDGAICQVSARRESRSGGGEYARRCSLGRILGKKLQEKDEY